MKILIRNLARSTTEAELRDLFQEFGPIQSCTIVLDKETGLSKGFGFVEMPQQGDAKAAVKNLNGKDVGGSKIRVKKAEEKLEEKLQEEPEEKEEQKPVNKYKQQQEEKEIDSEPTENPNPKKKSTFRRKKIR